MRGYRPWPGDHHKHQALRQCAESRHPGLAYILLLVRQRGLHAKEHASGATRCSLKNGEALGDTSSGPPPCPSFAPHWGRCGRIWRSTQRWCFAPGLDPKLSDTRWRDVSGTLSSWLDTMVDLMTLWAESFSACIQTWSSRCRARVIHAPPALIEGTARFGPADRAQAEAFEARHGYRPTSIHLAVFVHRENPLEESHCQNWTPYFLRRADVASPIHRPLGPDGSRWALPRSPDTALRTELASRARTATLRIQRCVGFRATVNEQPGSASVVQQSRHRQTGSAIRA